MEEDREISINFCTGNREEVKRDRINAITNKWVKQNIGGTLSKNVSNDYKLKLKNRIIWYTKENDHRKRSPNSQIKRKFNYQLKQRTGEREKIIESSW